jgi:adenine-specific DNA-methyltransferase
MLILIATSMPERRSPSAKFSCILSKPAFCNHATLLALIRTSVRIMESRNHIVALQLAFGEEVDYSVDKSSQAVGYSPVILEIVRLALACGADTLGGPLSRREVALAGAAGSASSRAAGRIRAQIRAGADPLGDSLCRARVASERRKTGSFFTSAALIGPMMEWVLGQRPEQVIDPGCGSGRFSIAAATRIRRLPIIAIDVDPVATLLTRAGLAAVGARNVRVLNDDYLTCEIPHIDGRSGFVGNPPYVRHHELSQRTKERAAKLAMHVGYALSRLAGLHALFYLATFALHGRRGDVGSFVTSAEWLDVGYGSLIRQAFVNGLGGRSLAVFDPQALPFEDAMTTAAISTFEIGARVDAVRASQISSPNELDRLETGLTIDRRSLATSSRWSSAIRGGSAREEPHCIGSAFRVSRGQVTGANDYFVMSRERARQLGIEGFCSAVVACADEVFRAKGVLKDTPQRLVALEIPRETDISRHKALAAYIDAGEVANLHQRYVTSRRRPWYSIAFPRPPIVATYMARQAPTFASNPDRLGVLNIAHGLYPRESLDDDALDRIVKRLNATRDSFVGRGRTYHGGLEKFEPREMENLPLEIT